jgi:PPOX class probable F420-dependent enzyme
MLMADARTAILTAEFVALTTYRLDGRAVTTPVWAAAEDGRLYIFSNAKAGKVKRLRNSGRATLAPCTFAGKITGSEHPAEAVLLPADQMPRVWQRLIKKYGLPARAFAFYDWLRNRIGMEPSAGIEVRLTP